MSEEQTLNICCMYLWQSEINDKIGLRSFIWNNLVCIHSSNVLFPLNVPDMFLVYPELDNIERIFPWYRMSTGKKREYYKYFEIIKNSRWLKPFEHNKPILFKWVLFKEFQNSPPGKTTKFDQWICNRG